MTQPSIPFIDLKSQFKALEPRIRERMDRVLAHGQYILGPEVQDLEEKLQQFVGVQHCLAVTSRMSPGLPDSIIERVDDSLLSVD